MSRIQNVAITLLFIISAVSAEGSKLDKSDIIINDQTDPVPLPITEINKVTPGPGVDTTPTPSSTTTGSTSTTKPPLTTGTSTTSTTTKLTTISTTTTTTTTSPITPSTLKPNVTTATTVKPTGAPSTPVPSHRRFDGPSFIGGIVLALGLVAIGFVAFKFYKARTELNYHTL